eukprot:scaffold84338_cov45-Phaeocystis_antarctica.AAC.1
MHQKKNQGNPSGVQARGAQRTWTNGSESIQQQKVAPSKNTDTDKIILKTACDAVGGCSV